MARSVAEEWEKRFQARAASYRSTDGTVLGMPRFIRSPWIQYLVTYTGLKPGDRVLEAGCASGKFSMALACLGCSVTALDFSEEMVANASELRAKVEAAYGPLDVSVVKGDITRLTFPDDSFDLVFNEGVVEHWLDRTERTGVLAEMRRVAKKGGSVAVFAPNGRHPLYRWWMLTRYPGYCTAPPMIRYDGRGLREDLELVGCREVATDGVAPYHSISQWPDPKVLQYASIAMNKYLPQPKWLRERLGIHLFACGRK